MKLFYIWKHLLSPNVACKIQTNQRAKLKERTDGLLVVFKLLVHLYDHVTPPKSEVAHPLAKPNLSQVSKLWQDTCLESELKKSLTATFHTTLNLDSQCNTIISPIQKNILWRMYYQFYFLFFDLKNWQKKGLIVFWKGPTRGSYDQKGYYLFWNFSKWLHYLGFSDDLFRLGISQGSRYEHNIKNVKTEVVILTMLPPAPIKQWIVKPTLDVTLTISDIDVDHGRQVRYEDHHLLAWGFLYQVSGTNEINTLRDWRL